MTLIVNSNIASLTARNQLFDTATALEVSYQRLSSGFRINSASDDVAGLQIVDRFTSQLEGLNMSIRNANDAISLVQTAEGALQETTTSLQRIRQLAIQAQNGINSSADRAALQEEVSQLIQEVSRVSSSTQFAGNDLLVGTFSSAFQVGANSSQTISVNISRSGGFGASGLGVGTVDIASATGASSAITAVDSAISSIGAQRASLGALQNRFQSAIRNLSNVSENLSSARSRIQDTDFASETANLTRVQILQQAATSVLAQSNQRPQSALSLLG
ncbi:MAG: flagellin FliC [Alteromonadaceae bacterium]|nr:flagellin FliC [Alteromonadaceae bacterium]